MASAPLPPISPTDSYLVLPDKVNAHFEPDKKYHAVASQLFEASQVYHRKNQERTTSQIACVESIEALTALADDEHASLLRHLAKVLRTSGIHEKRMMFELSNRVLKPMSNFVNYDFAEELAAKNKVQKSIRQYTEALNSFSKDSIVKDGKILGKEKLVAWEESVSKLKKEIEENVARFIDAKERYQRRCRRNLMRHICRMVREQFTSIRNTYLLYMQLMPQLDEVESELDNEPPEFVKEGHLMVKKTTGWSRGWFVMTKSALLSFRSDKDFDMEKAIPLKLCHVRPSRRNKKLGFELITPARKRPLRLQAENEVEFESWIAALEGAIHDSLGEDSPNRGLGQHAETVVFMLSNGRGNNKCVDCKSPNPRWASINLGALLCVECSGVHRSLGSHISKVRSLSLDNWDSMLMKFMMRMGNDAINGVLEREPCDVPKITHASERAERTAYVKAKYQDRVMMKKTELTPEEATKELCHLVELSDAEPSTEDLQRLLELVLGGADPTPAFLLAAQHSHPLLLQVLVLNNANVYAADEDGDTAFHICAAAGAVTCLAILLKATCKDQDARALLNHVSMTPLEMCDDSTAESEQCKALLERRIDPDDVLPTIEDLLTSDEHLHKLMSDANLSLSFSSSSVPSSPRLSSSSQGFDPDEASDAISALSQSNGDMLSPRSVSKEWGAGGSRSVLASSPPARTQRSKSVWEGSVSSPPLSSGNDGGIASPKQRSPEGKGALGAVPHLADMSDQRSVRDLLIEADHHELSFQSKPRSTTVASPGSPTGLVRRSRSPPGTKRHSMPVNHPVHRSVSEKHVSSMRLTARGDPSHFPPSVPSLPKVQHRQYSVELPAPRAPLTSFSAPSPSAEGAQAQAQGDDAKPAFNVKRWRRQSGLRESHDATPPPSAGDSQSQEVQDTDEGRPGVSFAPQEESAGGLTSDDAASSAGLLSEDNDDPPSDTLLDDSGPAAPRATTSGSAPMLSAAAVADGTAARQEDALERGRSAPPISDSDNGEAAMGSSDYEGAVGDDASDPPAASGAPHVAGAREENGSERPDSEGPGDGGGGPDSGGDALPASDPPATADGAVSHGHENVGDEALRGSRAFACSGEDPGGSRDDGKTAEEHGVGPPGDVANAENAEAGREDDRIAGDGEQVAERSTCVGAGDGDEECTGEVVVCSGEDAAGASGDVASEASPDAAGSCSAPLGRAAGEQDCCAPSEEPPDTALEGDGGNAGDGAASTPLPSASQTESGTDRPPLADAAAGTDAPS